MDTLEFFQGEHMFEFLLTFKNIPSIMNDGRTIILSSGRTYEIKHQNTQRSDDCNWNKYPWPWNSGGSVGSGVRPAVRRVYRQRLV